MKHLKKCSTSVVIMEMQIKTILRFHHTAVRMMIINSGDSRCKWGCGERGTLLHCCWDCKLVLPLWKSVWWLLRKLGMTIMENHAIPFLGIYPEDSLACNKVTCSTMSITPLFIIARNWKEPWFHPMDEWIQKMWYIYTVGYYSVNKTMHSWNP